MSPAESKFSFHLASVIMDTITIPTHSSFPLSCYFLPSLSTLFLLPFVVLWSPRFLFTFSIYFSRELLKEVSFDLGDSATYRYKALKCLKKTEEYWRKIYDMKMQTPVCMIPSLSVFFSVYIMSVSTQSATDNILFHACGQVILLCHQM